MAKTEETSPSDISHGLAALPYLSDEPLDAPWMSRGHSEASGSPAAIATMPIPVVDDPQVDGDDEPGDEPQTGSRRRWPRRLLTLLAAFMVVALVAVAGTGFYAQRQFDQIERVEVAELLAPIGSAGTNYLIVGSDSRENLDPNVDNAGAIFGDGSQEIGGQRTDTIQILRITDDGSHHMLALPRDLYVPIGGDGAGNRINAAYAFGGAELLIKTVEGSLGIPIHHYAEIDFAGFIDLVDSVGGVTIDFPYPAHDPKTGLDIPEAGPATLDSTQALAFVRSRMYRELIDGQWVVDPRGDLGRVKRQQAFLQALFEEVQSPRNALSVLSDLDNTAGSVKLDDRMSFGDALELLVELRDTDLNTDWDLVVSHWTTPAGAQVLQLDAGASQETLAFFTG
ncbi:MAG: LCP family protein [Acidimicrobiales bacterium]|nr:LCP family protein [Acidimicrobiales bacterium]